MRAFQIVISFAVLVSMLSTAKADEFHIPKSCHSHYANRIMVVAIAQQEHIPVRDIAFVRVTASVTPYLRAYHLDAMECIDEVKFLHLPPEYPAYAIHTFEMWRHIDGSVDFYWGRNPPNLLP